MAIDAEDLVIQPFRELVERGREAVSNAEDAADEEPDAAKVMIKAATGLIKEGERALGRIQPLWESQSQKYGEAFTSAIRDDATIAEERRLMEDLLYDFDDYTELDTFEADRYTKLQSASKSFARSAIETMKTMKIDVPVTSTVPSMPAPSSNTPITPTSPDPGQLAFPPLPPLPPMSPKSAASRPQTAYEATYLNHQSEQTLASFPVPPVRGAPGMNSVRSSRSDGLARNGTRMSQASQGSDKSNQRSSSRLAMNPHTSATPTTQYEVAETAHRASPNLEVLGQEFQRVRLAQNGVTHNPSSQHGHKRTPSQGEGTLRTSSPGQNWAVPRTTAWVTEQAGGSTDEQRYRDSIPEDTLPGLSRESKGHMRPAAANRYTSDSSKRASSVFDSPGSPDTSGYRTSHPGTEYLDSGDHLELPPRARSRMQSLTEQIVDDEILPIQQQDPHSFDTGLILAREDDSRGADRSQIPIWYSRQANCSIGPESTLYVQGGFCRGAVAFRKDGYDGATKSTYEYTLKKTDIQCVSCEYRQDAARIQNDIRRATNANFITEGVIYRSRFLYKSHMSTNLHTSTPFACLFCAQDGRTTREGDATVFRNKDQLFKHLASHPQPLPPVNGVTVLYGTVDKNSDEATDFDVHFPEPPRAASITDDQSAQLARLPTALGKKDHIEGYGPDNLETSILRFYAGARIIGIEFPTEHDGKWCRGWHDGLQGYFPSKSVELEPPSKAEVRLPGMNHDGITLKARWKWQPTDKGAGWLSFDKGDTISNVSWTSQEQWCWSGITRNGKMGFFPQSHMKPESITNATPSTTPNFSSAKSIKSGSKKKMFGLRRTATTASDRS